MKTTTKTLTYAEAIRCALEQRMKEDDKTIIYGLGVDDPKAMYGTLKDFPKKYGAERCFDTPLSEDCMTGFGIGLALSGYYPIHVHQRTDFLLLCCNQLINMGAKIRYLSNGLLKCPFIIRAITGRSWGQGSQHSQSFHSMFANIPGIKVLTPATANDVFNCYLNAHKNNCPTIIIEHRMLYTIQGEVSASDTIPKTSHLSKGDDLTICSFSHMTIEAERAIRHLERAGIRTDHFSIVDNTNLETERIFQSVQKTKRLVVIDHGWLNASVAKTIVCNLYMKGYKGNSEVIGYLDSPCPTARNLELIYYPSPSVIAKTCIKLMKKESSEGLEEISPEILNFKGPF